MSHLFLDILPAICFKANDPLNLSASKQEFFGVLKTET